MPRIFSILIPAAVFILVLVLTKSRNSAIRSSDKNKLCVSRSGKSYYWNYIRKTGRYGSPLAELSVPADFAFTFYLKDKEEIQWWEFAKKYQTHDPQFDDQVGILSGNEGFCDLLRNNSILRQIALDVFSRGIGSLSLRQDRLTAGFKYQYTQPLLPDEAVDFLVQRLENFKQKLPKTTGM